MTAGLKKGTQIRQYYIKDKSQSNHETNKTLNIGMLWSSPCLNIKEQIMNKDRKETKTTYTHVSVLYLHRTYL